MTTYVNRSVQSAGTRSVLRFLRDKLITISIITGVLVAFAVGSLWIMYNAGVSYTEHTGTVVAVKTDHDWISCGKSMCRTTEYHTTVDLGDQHVAVTLDEELSVGDVSAVYEMADGSFDGYSPTSGHTVALIVAFSLVAGVITGAAVLFSIAHFTYSRRY